jgi:hypothetical protein
LRDSRMNCANSRASRARAIHLRSEDSARYARKKGINHSRKSGASEKTTEERP